MAGFSFNINDVLKRTLYIQEKVIFGCTKYAETAANRMVTDAKRNAKWTDRTGLSRQTIDSQVTYENGIVVIRLRGNTAQFQYLEYAMEKRFAILHPTVEKFTPSVLRGWANTVKGI